MASTRIRWTPAQAAAIKDENGKFTEWLDAIGFKRGMSHKEVLPGASESITAHRLKIAESLMEMKTDDGQPVFPQEPAYTNVRINSVHYFVSDHVAVSPCK